MVQVRRPKNAAKLRLRSKLLLSTAATLAGFTLAGGAQAQTYQDTGAGAKTYTVTAITGTPEAMLVTSSDGAVTIDAGNVSATSVAADTGNVLEARTSGTNPLTVTVGSLGVTGDGAVKGIFTWSGTGLTTINATGIDMFGRAGILAQGDGDVAIDVGNVVVRGPDDGENIDAIAVGRYEDVGVGQVNVGGNVTINAGSVEARGSTDAYAIHADAMGDIAVTTGAVRSDGEGVDVASDGGDVTIALNGDVDVAEGAVNASGQNVSVTIAEGVTVTAGGGAVEAEDEDALSVSIVNNGTVINTGANGESGQSAIFGRAEGAVTIVSNVATSNSNVDASDDESATVRGISGTGPVNITTGTTTTNGESMYGVWGYSNSGAVTIDAGTTISTAADWNGTYTAEAVVGSTATGSVTINSGDAQAGGWAASAIVGSVQGATGGDVTIVSGEAHSTNTTRSGTAIFGSSAGGDVTITTTGNTSSVTDGGIFASGRDVRVTTGADTTTSGGGAGINVTARRDAVLNVGDVSATGGAITTAAYNGISVAAVRDISITAGDVTVGATSAATTAQNAAGIRAVSNAGNANGGNIAISSGSVSVSGANRHGIRALTTGDITITTAGDTVSAGASGIFATGRNVSITTAADTVTSGGGISAIQVGSSGNVVINNAGSAISAGTTPTISAAGTGKVSITSAETVNAGTGYAIVANGGNGAEIHAGIVSTTAAPANGMLALATAGDAVIELGTFIGSAALNAVSAQANNGAASITAASVTNMSAAPGSWGINAVARQGVTIVAGDVEAQGTAIRAQTNLGSGDTAPIPLNDSHVSITTTGAVTSRGGTAISISGNVASFDVTVGENSVVTGNSGSAAIAGGARLGDIEVTNLGRVVMGGTGETGIGVTASGGGNVTIASNEISVASDTVPTSGFLAGAISAVSQNGDGNVSVTSAKATVSGANRYGIAATAAGTGTVAVTSGELTKDADDYAGIYARSASGDIVIASETLTNSGVGAKGIDAISSGGGDITITSGTLINSATGSTANIAEGIYGDTHGKVTITAGSTEVFGYGASAIVAIAGDAVDIASDSIVTHGDDTTALYAGTLAGGVTVDSGTIRTSGNQASAIGVATDAGATSVTSGQIATTGVSSYGISARGTTGSSVTSGSISVTGQNAFGISAITSAGDAVVNAGDVTAARYGVLAQSSSGNASITLTGNTRAGLNFTPTHPTSGAALFGYGARGVGNDVTITTAAGTTTSAVDTGLEAIAANRATVVNGGTVAVDGANAIGIKASAANGLSITSNAITVAGVAADPGIDPATGFRAARGAIVAEGGAGAISIDSGSVSVAGNNRYGIYAHGTGAISVASDSLSYEAADSAGIMIVGGSGAVTVDSGTLTGSGTSGAGIVARSTSGDITIVADKTRLTGTGVAPSGYTADAVVGLSTSGAVSITSNEASTDGYAGSAIAGVGASVSVTSGKASATGNDGAIVYASATGGTASVNSGTVTTTGTATQAISARATGDVTVTSANISALGAGSAGIRATATGSGTVKVTTGNVAAAANAVRAVSTSGATTVSVNGTVSSANAAAIVAQGASVEVTVLGGSTVSGATGGIQASGTTVSITNSGTIAATSGAAITASGQTHLINAGTINGTAGSTAVLLGGTDDLVTLRSGSVVRGVIDTGAGIDTIELVGANGGTIAQFANAEKLDVQSGLWTTGTTGNAFDSVGIRSGAELQVNLSSAGDSGIETGSVLNNGVLAFNYANTAEAGEIDGVAITGTGDLRLIGAGELVFADAGVAHTGTTRVEAGKLTLTGSLASDVVTTGAGIFQLGEGSSFTGDLLNNGTFIYARSDSYTIAGNFSGTGSLVKQGAGILTFGGLYDFTGVTTIQGGSVRFAGQLAEDSQIDLQSGTLDLSAIQGGQQTIGELSGSAGGSVQLGSSQLTVNQNSNTNFAGSIGGTGGLVKEGTGTLNLTGTSTFTGATQVEGGTLKVNGALPNSTVMVQPGGTLGGNGLVGGLQMTGGTLAPGNSIGRLTVNGAIVLNAASVYAVEVNAAGAADRIDATGSATLGGATLQVLAEAGRYKGRTSYTILTAAGGVSGTFGRVTSNFAFLTPSVAYGATAVTLNLTRNDASFASLGTTQNQRSVGTALQSLGGGNALFEEALLLQDSRVAPDFGSLSGELHAGVSSGMVENAQAVRRAMLSTPAATTQGGYGWATLIGNWGTAKESAESLRLETEQQGVIGGVGVSGQGFNGALGIGMVTSDFRSSGSARGKSTLAVGSLGYTGGGFSATIGGTYAWNTIKTSRVATIGGIANGLTDEYDGTTWQAFGEVAYGLATGPVEIMPFAGLSHVENKNDAVTESGGATALDIAAAKQKVTFSDVGVRLSGIVAEEVPSDSIRVAPYASAAWRHGWGDRAGSLGASFAGTTTQFGILGPVIAKDAAELALGLGVVSGPVQVSLGYNGAIASQWSNHSAQLKVAIGF